MSEEKISTQGQDAPNQFGKQGRDYSVDVLRCFSCWMVIVVHVANIFVNGRYGAPQQVAGTLTWDFLVLLKGMFVSATTLFVMVSGIFFLSPSRRVTPKKIWAKNILKLACAYVFWSFAYALYNIWFAGKFGDMTAVSLVKAALQQPFHLWYIPMLISLYVIAPFVRLITAKADQKLYRYGIVILVGALLLNTMRYLPELPYHKYLTAIITRTPAEELCGYASFFIFGYYLYSYRPGLGMRKAIYLFGVLSVVISSAYCILFRMHGVDVWDDHFFAKLTITTFGKNTAIFLFILTAFSKVEFSARAKKILVKLSNCTLIIYLIHIIIVKQIIRMGWFSTWNLGVATVVEATVTYLIGFVFAFAFQIVPWKKIGFIKRIGAVK